MTLLVRAAGESDIDAIAALEVETLGADAWSLGLVAQGVLGALPTVHYLVAELDGVAVGHAVASLAGEVVELQRIGVQTAARRTGVASALVAAVDALATEDGAERLLLEVRHDNAGALAFYAAHLFMEIARRPRYYSDGSAAVVLQRELVAQVRGAPDR